MRVRICINKYKEVYFISTKLLLNLISDFRARKTIPYFSSDGKEFVDRTKILPLGTREFKVILEKDIKYREPYTLFKQTYQSTFSVKDWYKK